MKQEPNNTQGHDVQVCIGFGQRFKLLRTTRSRRLTASENMFAKVKELLSSAGFDLTVKTRKTTPIHVKMSDDMREYIWSHAQANESALSKFKLVFLKR